MSAWEAVLDALAADLDALAAPAPHAPAGWTPPAAPAAPPTAAERARLESLLTRAGALQRRLAAQLREVTDELTSLRVRSEAATRYRRQADGGPPGAGRSRSAAQA